jgi:heme A synthase
MNATTATPVVPRWLHIWAILTLCAALPLVLLGAEVTTRQAGMVDSQGIRTPWHLFTVPLNEMPLAQRLQFVVEHSHRVFGWIVGSLAIGLAIAMPFAMRHTRLRWLGCLALFMVSAQGVLGIIRVNFNQLQGPGLALIHGLFAQLVLATLTTVAVITSPRWWTPPVDDATAGLRRPAALLTLFVFIQIAFGGFVRHLADPSGQRLHLMFAFVVAATCVWLLFSIRERSGAQSVGLRRTGWVLAFCLILQLSLGAEAWMRRGGSVVLRGEEAAPRVLANSAAWQPDVKWITNTICSGHYAVGALLFGTSVVLNLLLYRPRQAILPTLAPTPRATIVRNGEHVTPRMESVV